MTDRLPTWAHPQWLVTALAVIVAVAGLTVPLAHADDRDDLEDKQDQVQGQISDVKGDIHEASQKAAKIARQLKKARNQLNAARSRLSAVQADLKDAREVADKLARKLVVAERRLKIAKADLKQARQEVAIQRLASRDAIIVMASGDDAQMALLNAYMNSGSIEDVMVSQTAYDLVTGRQNQALVLLEEAEVAMEKRKIEVNDARNDVASAKKSADENVVTIADLVDKAAATESQVASLVSRTNGARQAVIQARAADQAALARLKKREERIKARIVRLSQQQGGSYNGDTGGLLFKPGPGPVTSPYGYRIHPIYGYYGLHNGIDFGTGCGAALWAGESGTVINRYYDEVYGNRLYIAIGRVNGASMTLVYNHLTSYAVGQGQKVRRGQVVGYSGTTGWSTGCHLHFTVLRNGNAVDPAPYL
ncbi:MAG: peptidoglycan DD-metalloendopeptidase family protein [Propionibacteriales bacterium]|nr:peptidoglycan DD-metalloendopeptidase family protein [Propionibacteriales bacterium]